MIKKEVTGSKEVRYIEKEIKYNLTCDICGKEIFSGDSKERLLDKEKECYKIVKPVWGKIGIVDEEVIHLCDDDCYSKFISKEFIDITKFPGLK